MEEHVRVYSHEGTNRDEGGNFKVVKKEIPPWVKKARKHCGGCHDNFYNGMVSCTGDSWCWSLKKSYANRKSRPSCFH